MTFKLSNSRSKRNYRSFLYYIEFTIHVLHCCGLEFSFDLLVSIFLHFQVYQQCAVACLKFSLNESKRSYFLLLTLFFIKSDQLSPIKITFRTSEYFCQRCHKRLCRTQTQSPALKVGRHLVKIITILG